MQRYITQLIEDMRESTKNLPPKPDYEHDWGPELDYVIEWENNPAKTMGEWFGMKKEQFPPVAKLDESQIALMNKAFLELWVAYNFYPDFPDDFPEDRKYILFRRYISENIVWVSEGDTIVDFCTGDPCECELKEYCPCRDLPE